VKYEFSFEVERVQTEGLLLLADILEHKHQLEQFDHSLERPRMNSGNTHRHLHSFPSREPNVDSAFGYRLFVKLEPFYLSKSQQQS
jgi:hypothetical protein